ncbi:MULTISPECIES: UDP-N-acetylmuramoyl-tripeptide--D-alanyl-D-alanine ligase [Thermoanaerobacterium]|uniref:UDP-N-acetylmuramoyl-tripeptide--D-alanyl-D-alanine ligase n=2 Tax=Thermoanaerobacterium TaxID=28895 RepID=W9EFC6_9THEO|nr:MULTISPECIES: UDP-N-acetylmuramoyl-tripeptide--D-alanyl-D-alanine ligase [Thermoanaerobacterium]AFK86572.1 UDP-N-acetylmuramoylalanyl-D-glutamyl-2,6-diaminopimelate/D-alanyl-D-alanyl ligase [Thermoanaerobacterium saccharolyticum JW/SL-YS485]ETO38414.1 UDP-N-acetylmuramoylalanyl-D-glutamyl-2, 6-diaminopimelate/D-alanyl-D-alanyl ligase [Thermoanaerobacterium aotearoense SCUT27]
MILTVKEILDATEGKLLSGDINICVSGISTDSRTIKSGDLFIPLKGERFNGEEFIDDALNVASASLTESINYIRHDNKPIIFVKDTKDALHRIAKYYRSKFDIPFIAVTGSSGKTTTKDMIYDVLSMKYNVLKTIGNFNNEIGLPLTLFKLNDDHEMAVVEMGMSGFGEIRRLKNIASPNVAVYTNIGVAHIEKLGSRENILKAKSELIEDFKDGDTIVINADDDMLIKLLDKKGPKFVTYGINNGNIKAFDIELKEESSKYKVLIDGCVLDVELNVPGKHNIYNSLAAICIGIQFDVNKDDIRKALSEFQPSAMRLNIIDAFGIKIINDVYNANPSSMKAALSVLGGYAGKRKIAVLGNMLELGQYADVAHREVGEHVKENDIDVLITVGDYALKIADGAVEKGMDKNNVFRCGNNAEAIDVIKNIMKESDVFLVKGSRGMKMEEIVKFLQESAYK